MIEDLTAKVSDPKPKNRQAPQWAAIDKKQQAYEKAMEEYEFNQSKIDEEYIYLKETWLVELRKSITEKEEEIELLKEKIKIKLKIVKERQALIDHYEPERGDKIDEAMAAYFNQPGERVPIQWLSPGEYMFGTYRISCKPNTKYPEGFQVTLVKDNKTISPSDLFGRIATNILNNLDKLEDDHELLVQEDQKVETRPVESPSPTGTNYKKSPQKAGYGI